MCGPVRVLRISTLVLVVNWQCRAVVRCTGVHSSRQRISLDIADQLSLSPIYSVGLVDRGARVALALRSALGLGPHGTCGHQAGCVWVSHSNSADRADRDGEARKNDET